MAVSFFKAGEKFEKLKFLVPGVALFATKTGQGIAKGLAVAAGNVGAELARFEGYRRLSEAVGGKSAGQFVSRGYLFAGGLVSGLEEKISSKLAEDILAGHSNPILERVLRNGVSDDRLAKLAETIADHAGERAVGLPKGVSKEVLYRQLKWKLHLEKIVARGQTMGTIRALQKELRRLAEKHSAVKPLLERLGKVMQLEDKKQVVEQLKTMIGEAKETIQRAADEATARAEAAAQLTRGRREVRRAEYQRERKATPSRGERELVARGPEEPRTRVSTPSHPLTPLEMACNQAPAEISEKIIGSLTEGRVKVHSTKVMRALEEFYQNNPDKRGSFWRSLRDIVSGQSRDLKIDDWWTQGVYTRVGRKWRLFVRRSNGFIEIMMFEKRGALKWTEA